MQEQREGIVFVVSAPSGAGKTTLIQRLLSEFPNFSFSVSYTTRKPREHEVNGREYHFVSTEEFLVLQQNNFFVEWACVHDSYYGTPLETTRSLLKSGRDVLFDIDVQGAEQLYSILGEGFYVFIFPPSYHILKERLCSRRTDTEEDIIKRLQNAKEEVQKSHWFSAWIVNDSIDEAYQQLREAYLTATLAPRKHGYFLEKLLSQWQE